MIVRSSKVLYAFDFDGTLFGDIAWRGFWKNTISCFKSGPFLNPTSYDIRWCVLSGRPKIDRFLIWLVCNMNGLYPTHIFTASTFTYQFKDSVENYKFKVSCIKSILDANIQLSSFVTPIEKVFYIDNDLDCVQFLNNEKGSYTYQAITAIEFIEGKFNFYL